MAFGRFQKAPAGFLQVGPSRVVHAEIQTVIGGMGEGQVREKRGLSKSFRQKPQGFMDRTLRVRCRRSVFVLFVSVVAKKDEFPDPGRKSCFDEKGQLVRRYRFHSLD